MKYQKAAKSIEMFLFSFHLINMLRNVFLAPQMPSQLDLISE